MTSAAGGLEKGNSYIIQLVGMKKADPHKLPENLLLC